MSKENKYKINKKFDQSLGGTEMGGSPRNGCQNLNFLTIDAGHEIFSIGQYKEEIKFYKICEYQKEGAPQTGPPSF